MKDAATVAGAWGDEHIGAHHLLAALLRDGGGAVARVFLGRGVTAEQFETKVQSIIIKHRPPGSHPGSETRAVQRTLHLTVLAGVRFLRWEVSYDHEVVGRVASRPPQVN
ncbi:MAG: Clp protease N-terminal domain-containing protein [Gemmatimonadaceae bacterium]